MSRCRRRATAPRLLWKVLAFLGHPVKASRPSPRLRAVVLVFAPLRKSRAAKAEVLAAH